MDFDQPPVLSVEQHPERPAIPSGTWPMTIPAVAQIVADGFQPAPGVTFLVGENGSRKSTIVEAVAMAFGMSPEGGSTHGEHQTRATESSLAANLVVRRGRGAGRWGFFLRAETMHGWYTFMDSHASERDPDFHAMSHGESFLAVLQTRFDSSAFFCLDEPEAALSFSSTLGLIAILQRVVDQGGQVLCATHSPVLAAMPGATILEVGDWGLREVEWADLDLVGHWQRFLEAPERYLRHLRDQPVGQPGT